MTIDQKPLIWIELSVLISLVLVYGWATYEQNIIWRDEINLWSDVVKKSQFKARPHNNLGVAYNEKNLSDLALTEATKALKLRRNYPNPFVSIGDAYFKKDSPDMAIMAYKNALSIKSDYADAYSGMGNVYAKKGEMDLALDAFKKAVEFRPKNIINRINLAAAYGSKGLTDQAIAELQYTLTIKPDNPDIHYNLGVAYEQLAKNSKQNDLILKAIKHYKEAIRINPSDFEARERLMKLRSKDREQ